MNRYDSEALDRHITGNYGEDQFSDEHPARRNLMQTPEFYEELALEYAGTEMSPVYATLAQAAATVQLNETMKRGIYINPVSGF